MKKLKFLFFILLFGCSTSQLKQSNVEGYQNTPLIIKYFFQDIPVWANFSQNAQCRRTYRPKYFDFKKMEADTSFDYKKLVQFQYLYNIEYNRLLQSLGDDSPSVKEEENLFYDVLANIRTDIFPFNPPKFQRVNLIWIDPYLNDKNDFYKMIESNALISGHPVFLSLCLSNQEIVDLIKKNDLQNKDIRIISFEALNMFDVALNSQNVLRIDLNQFFEKNQKLIFYNLRDQIPNEFFGEFEIAK